MSFFTKLMLDAQPKAAAIQRVTSRISSATGNNVVVNIAKNVGYKSLVNTVGIAAVLAKPAVDKARVLGAKLNTKLGELAAEQK